MMGTRKTRKYGRGIEVYTNWYIEVRKEQLKETEMMEEKRGTTVYEIIEPEVQELIRVLDMPASSGSEEKLRTDS